jgi:flagellar hook-basal body complex protein FliE
MSGVGPIIGMPMLQPHEGLPLRSEAMAPVASEATAIPFGDMLSEAVMHANAQGMSAENAVQAFAAGARDDIHGTMLAVKEAEIELKLVSNVRTKLVEAFNDLWRMSV